MSFSGDSLIVCYEERYSSTDILSDLAGFDCVIARISD